MSALGFAAPAWRRLVVAGLFAAAAGLAAWSVERIPLPVPAAAAVPAAQRRAVRLDLEAAFPVGAWRVTSAGKELPGAPSDAHHWHGGAELPAGAEILVEVSPADAGSSAPLALRLILRHGDGASIERSVWGTGQVVEALRLP